MQSSKSHSQRIINRCTNRLRLYWNNLIKTLYTLKYIIKRLLNNKFARNLVLVCTILLFVILWIMFVKIPQDRLIKSIEMTQLLSKTLGTRITAVRVKPDKVTTLLQPPNPCDNVPFAAILVESRPEDTHKRTVARNTWFRLISKMDETILSFFFIGLPAYEDITSLQNEANENEDILVEDLDENFYLLGLKTLRILKWFMSNCSKAKYLIITDDDMFVHVPNLIAHINSVPNAWVNYVGGQLRLDDQVDRDPESKYFVPKDWWAEEEFPPYVTGGITVLSSEVVPLLFNKSLTVPLFHLEDVFLTGIVGFQNLQIVPSDIPGIESNNPKWITRFKINFMNIAKTHVAFHCPGDSECINELYNLSIG